MTVVKHLHSAGVIEEPDDVEVAPNADVQLWYKTLDCSANLHSAESFLVESL